MSAILFVFDKSGSMSWGLDGSDQAAYPNRRIDYAKAALLEQLARLSDRAPMGLIFFPYQQSCDTAVIYPIAAGQKSGIQGIISGLDIPWCPKGSFGYGGTPLAAAINLAGQVAQQYGQSVKIVVLTDGEETCSGDPVAVAAYWRQQGLDLQISLIGFVVDANVRQNLITIASAGGGRYYDAQNAAQLSSALGSAMQTGRAQPVPRAYTRAPRPEPVYRERVGCGERLRRFFEALGKVGRVIIAILLIALVGFIFFGGALQLGYRLTYIVRLPMQTLQYGLIGIGAVLWAFVAIPRIWQRVAQGLSVGLLKGTKPRGFWRAITWILGIVFAAAVALALLGGR